MKTSSKQVSKTAIAAVIFLIGICLLSGCISRQEPQPSSTPQPTESPEPSPTPSPTQEPQSQPTVIGEFTTKILDQQSGRVNNIKLASAAVSKITVASGETFSFNATVGRRTPEKGYKKAAVLIDGEKEYEYGGGICQVSSTLYNAAKEAGLDITERHTHSAEVHYIELGNDAAVSYGDQDLKFVNTQESPISFQITVNSDMTLTAKVLMIQEAQAE